MVGIITFHTQYNCGSALQAYAMQEAVKKLGYERVFLNYYYKKDMSIYDIRWRAGLKVACFDLLTWPKSARRKRAYRKFASRHFNMTKQTTNWEELTRLSQPCSTLLCGSDQIWNLAIVEGVHPAYFLKFASEKQRRVSYAPSVSNDTVLAQYADGIRDALQGFSAISVREKSFAGPLSEIIGCDVIDVVDPTLLHAQSTYDLLVRDYHLKLPQKYVFIYCLHNHNFRKLRLTAEKIAQEKNLKIVYFSKYDVYDRRYSRNIYPYDVRAFILAIKNAELVVSDSFHAGVFSVIYKKQFGTLELTNGNSRMHDFFRKFGIGDRVIRDGIFPKETIDYDTVYAKWAEERERSMAYLSEALKEERHAGENRCPC